MENNIIDILEMNGLSKSSKVARIINSWSVDKIEMVNADLFVFLEQQRENWKKEEIRQVSPFNCFAGSSIRGDSGCSHLNCRAIKLDLLARFSAMYADVVYLPVPLKHPEIPTDSDALKNRVINTVTSVLELRSLIESGIVRPVCPTMRFCEHCEKKALQEFTEWNRAIGQLAAKIRNEFAITYELVKDSPDLALLNIRGPEEYIEHGSLYTFLRLPPGWKRPGNGKTQLISGKSSIHGKYIGEVLQNIGWDVIFHHKFGPTFNATYLTDLAGETKFLQMLSKKDELAANTAHLFANLTHEVPFVTDIPIRTILETRNEYSDSFHLYRATVKKIVKDHVHLGCSITDAEAHDIYQDILAPTLMALHNEAKRQHARWVRKSVYTAALAIGVVTLGATGILGSPELMALLGGATIKGLVDHLADARTEPVTSDKLYFLLQLQKVANRRKKLQKRQ